MTPTAVLSIVKFEGGGGTHFLSTCPKPLAVISTDTNTDATLRREFGMSDDDEYDDDVCRYKQVDMPALVFDDRDDVQEQADERFEAVTDFLRPMLKDEDNRPKTLAFDTASDIFDLLVLKTFGKLDQIPPEVRRNMMGRVNTAYKGLVQAFKTVGVHVVLVHRAKEKWIDKTQLTQRGEEVVRSKLEGPFDMEREGFKGTGFITNVEIALAFDERREGKLSAKYGMKVTRCNPRPTIIGKRYWGKEGTTHKASFPFLMTQVYKGTSVEDWQ